MSRLLHLMCPCVKREEQDLDEHASIYPPTINLEDRSTNPMYNVAFTPSPVDVLHERSAMYNDQVQNLQASNPNFTSALDSDSESSRSCSVSRELYMPGLFESRSDWKNPVAMWDNLNNPAKRAVFGKAFAENYQTPTLNIHLSLGGAAEKGDDPLKATFERFQKLRRADESNSLMNIYIQTFQTVNPCPNSPEAVNLILQNLLPDHLIQKERVQSRIERTFGYFHKHVMDETPYHTCFMSGSLAELMCLPTLVRIETEEVIKPDLDVLLISNAIVVKTNPANEPLERLFAAWGSFKIPVCIFYIDFDHQSGFVFPLLASKTPCTQKEVANYLHTVAVYWLKFQNRIATPADFAKLKTMPKWLVDQNVGYSVQPLSSTFASDPFSHCAAIFSHEGMIGGAAGKSINTLQHRQLAFEQDFVYCFTCDAWPEEAKGIFHRQTKTQWPTQEILKDIQSADIFMVQKTNPDGSRGHTARFSFSVPEMILSRSLPHIARRMYFAVKLIQKTLLGQIKGLKSYYLKTLLFWILSSNELHHDDSSNILLFLSELENSFGKGVISHFFIPTINLLGHMKPKELIEVREALSCIQANHLAAFRFIQAEFHVIDFSVEERVEQMRNTAVIKAQEALRENDWSERRSLLLISEQLLREGLELDPRNIRLLVDFELLLLQQDRLEEMKGLLYLFQGRRPKLQDTEMYVIWTTEDTARLPQQIAADVQSQGRVIYLARQVFAFLLLISGLHISNQKELMKGFFYSKKNAKGYVEGLDPMQISSHVETRRKRFILSNDLCLLGHIHVANGVLNRALEAFIVAAQVLPGNSAAIQHCHNIARLIWTSDPDEKAHVVRGTSSRVLTSLPVDSRRHPRKLHEFLPEPEEDNPNPIRVDIMGQEPTPDWLKGVIPVFDDGNKRSYILN